MINKENILYRVFSKIIVINVAGAEYIVRAPNTLLRYRAEIYKNKIIDEYKYDLPDLELYDRFLIHRQYLDADHEKKIKDMSDTIRRFKVELYQCGPMIEREKEIRKHLKIIKDKLSAYVSDMEFRRKPALEYFAESLKNKFLLINTVYNKDDELVFDKDNLDTNLMTVITSELNENDIGGAEFREVARTDPWQGYWRANKTNLFGIPAMEYSEEQKILCTLSRMYDSVWEHQDCPNEKIIEDDDKLDGFLIYQSDKNKKDKTGDFSHIPDKYQEVYLTAKTQEEADSVYASNSPDAKRILRERAKVLKSKDEVKDLDFRDKQLDLLSQMAESESIAIQQRSR